MQPTGSARRIGLELLQLGIDVALRLLRAGTHRDVEILSHCR
jgi:hypothetical protein